MATPAPAQTSLPGFRLPSGNIACQLEASNAQPVLRCDLAQRDTVTPRPRDCDLEWGDAFAISAGGSSATLICHGDTMLDPTLPVLSYGGVWQRNGFTCASEQTGLSCFNAKRHGFSLSRAKQKVF